MMVDFVASLSPSPLFSSFVTVFTLILLYFPTLLLRIIVSPLLICTGILLFAILRVGACQRTGKTKEFNASEEKSPPPSTLTQHDRRTEELFGGKCGYCGDGEEAERELDSVRGLDRNPLYVDSFVEWNVRAPLEAIHEGYEGEEEENGDVFGGENDTQLMGIARYASLSLYYPETDSESSSDGDFPVVDDWDSPESVILLWEEEDNEGMIEIKLDGKRDNEETFHVEEENLIEIDISPARIDKIPGKTW